MRTKTISISTTNKVLSAYGGLLYFDDLVSKLNLVNKIRSVFPKTGVNQVSKFKSLLYGFICGLDSLNDISDLGRDPLFCELTGGACADSTLGDFLRAFSSRQIEELNEFLTSIAFQLRRGLKNNKDFVIFCSDSTPNVQYGKKMEGVGWNYKNQWCLDSLGIYDHHGLHYGFDVRSGGTYSSNGNTLLMRQVFKANENIKKFFLGDSAFANKDHYNTCLNGGCHFAMALRETSWGPLLEKELRWKKSSLPFFNELGCEIAESSYWLEGLAGGRKSLRVVLIRSKSRGKHYAIVTDVGLHQKVPVRQKRAYRGKRGKKREELLDYKLVPATAENIVNFYRARANVENFIKEEKYGLDLKHYPCKKLSANKVFALVGALAYNLMRYKSFTISKRGCFSKKIRNRLVNLPCQVVRHARRVIIKFNKFTAKEVERLMDKENPSFGQVDTC